MSEIRPNLFLGARSDTMEQRLLKNGITSVLSIEWAKPPLPSNICNKFVYVHDEPDADLLSFMPVCVQFIEESIQKGPILVHCFMGISRSSTIIAAYLMKSENISFDDALDVIRKTRPQARPNFGFRQQLDLFKKMNFTVDKKDRDYERYLLRELGDNFRDFPEIYIDEELCFKDDTTFTEVDLSAISTEYEDVLSRSGIAKEKVEKSILEWLMCLRQFLRQYRKDIADKLPLDIATRKSIKADSEFSANRIIELKYHQQRFNSELKGVLVTITDNNGLCMDVALYQTAAYLCFLKQFRYAVVTDSREFVILEFKEGVKVIQRARIHDFQLFMRCYSALFMHKI